MISDPQLLHFVSALDYLSGSFLAFVVLAFGVCVYAGPARRRYAVLALNLFFIANLLSLEALVLYAVLAMGVYGAGLAIVRGSSRVNAIFYAALACLLSVFVALRAPALRPALDAAIGGDGFTAQVGVVYGYSYFMFKSINFLVCANVGTLRNTSLVNYLNFMTFFSSFSAGPLARYGDHQDEDFSRRASTPEVIDGVQRILNGLIKKYVLVEMIGQFSLLSFDSPEAIRSVPAAWLATWGYLLYIYVDFSAYSDIAIGIGRILGYPLPENFDYPLLKRNLVQFWESWHMSLTSWIRDHVFTPMNWKMLQLTGFERTGTASVLPYLLTLSIFGLWHSLTLPFLVFGLLHGAALAATQRVVALRRKHLSADSNRWLEESLPSRVGGALFVNVFVALSLILFRFDLGDSWSLVRYLFTGTFP